MKMEIGSEFWKAEQKRGETRFVLSGRTAEELIIRDILCNMSVKSALLPAYCCHTMIEPFSRHHIPVRFYDVFWRENGGLQIELPEARVGEVLLLLRYFGYEALPGLDAEKVQAQWMCVVEDSTHSWPIEKARSFIPNYSFSSYRKWSGFGGIATAVKHGGSFQVPHEQSVHTEYIALRQSAEAQKEAFLEKGEGNKETYLSQFSQAEELLEKDYVGYLPDYGDIGKLLNLDVDYIRQCRRENAQVLLEGLRRIPGLKPVFPELGEWDVPLNVPVLVEPEKRDSLRRFLVDRQIYCPIHWPLSPYHLKISERTRELYNRELSLVCDQRYTTKDMEKQLERLKVFFTI